MISFINSWAQGIILAVIIATIIEIILPEGNNKKYVKTIIGIYIVFVMVYPLISKISNINIESIIDNANNQISKYDTNNNISIETNAYIEETYKQKLEEDIKQKINEKGYEINSLNLYIETDDDERYGQINSMVMQISKIKKTEGDSKTADDVTEKNEIKNIQNVEITITDNNINNKNNNAQNENISKEETDSLKEYLNSVYGAEKEKIHINE